MTSRSPPAAWTLLAEHRTRSLDGEIEDGWVRCVGRGYPDSVGERVVADAKDIPPGRVRGFGLWAVGNADGDYFAIVRRCPHLGADLAQGAVDKNGCLICPWHGAKIDVRAGRMVRGPQGVFARVPGLGRLFSLVTAVVPLPRRRVENRSGTIVLG